MNRQANNNRLLILLVVILLVSNIGVLLYFLSWNKPGRDNQARGGRGSVVDYVQKKIGFTDEQTTRYRDLYEQHHDSLRLLGEENRKARRTLFHYLQAPETPDSVIESAAGKIGASQTAIELNNFRHFRRVRALCTQDQLPRFDSMVFRIVNRQQGPRGGSRRDSGRITH